MMPKMLVLEDNKTRQKAFRRKFIGYSITIVEKAEEAISLLTENSYDYLCLDHDLGGQENVSSGPGTGYEVADWLSRNPERMPDTVIIHSYNVVGAQNMKRALPSAFVNPGIWL
jgi:CheY-like chemotaxis protein